MGVAIFSFGRDLRIEIRISLIENQFCQLAPALALELLGWWVYREPSILEFKFSMRGDRFSLREILARTTLFTCIANESIDLKYIETIRKDLIAGKVPRLPPLEKSLCVDRSWT